jgi:protein-S-isoprenylcysteine O-methyltransferase Ste14
MQRPAFAVTFIPLVAFIAIFITQARPPWPAYRLVGLALAIFGIVFLTIARINLGDSFSVTPQARQLVTSGVYSKIRHPVYVFSSFAVAGLFLYIRLPWLCLLVVPLLIMQISRARAEERVLTEKFGDAYTQYKETTWF